MELTYNFIRFIVSAGNSKRQFKIQKAIQPQHRYVIDATTMTEVEKVEQTKA